MSDESDNKCPSCGYVFPEIVAIGTKPDTVSGITSFGVVQECPKCLQMCTTEISVEEIGTGEMLKSELRARRGKRDGESN